MTYNVITIDKTHVYGYYPGINVHKYNGLRWTGLVLYYHYAYVYNEFINMQSLMIKTYQFRISFCIIIA